MILQGLPAVEDLEPLWLPHSSQCRPTLRPHPDRHCYREAELEERVADYMRVAYPHLTVTRQERWPGIGVPDIVARGRGLMGIEYLIVVELKAVPCTKIEYGQINWYIQHALDYYADRPERVAITGILGSFCYRDIDWRPDWFARWPMDIVD